MLLSVLSRPVFGRPLGLLLSDMPLSTLPLTVAFASLVDSRALLHQGILGTAVLPNVGRQAARTVVTSTRTHSSKQANSRHYPVNSKDETQSVERVI